MRKWSNDNGYLFNYTISTKRGSSGFGSAIKTLKDVKVVEILREGFHDPYKKLRCIILFFFLLKHNI